MRIMVPMILYLVTYQTKRKGITSVPEGEWMDKEKIIIGTKDATSVINVIKDMCLVHYFRLKGITEISKVDMIIPNLLK